MIQQQSKLITLTVDGVEVKVPPGTTILEAAKQAGINIPYLCYHPMLKPYGACRMCVVEVEKQRGQPASCTSPVAEGMAVKTNTPDVQKTRTEIMDLVLSEHPHGCLTCWRVVHCGPDDICLRNVSVIDRCVICPKNYRCELQFMAWDFKAKDTPLGYHYRSIPLWNKNPLIDHDMNLCIVCGRCVRACNEVEGADAIVFVNRGGRTIVGTSQGGSLAESGCTFCGACVDVCPVGAIVEKDSKWAGPARRTATTICPHCPVGCQIGVGLDKDGKIIRVMPDLDSPVNRGHACAWGKFGIVDYVHGKDRLTTPLVRKHGELVPATWDEALEAAARAFASHTGSEAGVIASPRSTNEDLFVLQKWARVVALTNNIDHTDHLFLPSAMAGLDQAIGGASQMTGNWQDIEKAKCLLAVGADLMADQPVIGARVRKAVQQGQKLIVVDPRRTESALRSTVWLRNRPGTEVAVLGGIMRVLLDERLWNAAYVEQRCEDFAVAQKAVEAFDLDTVEKTTGVPKAHIEMAARLLAKASPPCIVYSARTNLPGHNTDIASALADLALLTGAIGRPGGGLNIMRREANGQGCSDMGCAPILLPGYARVTDATARTPFERVWGRALPSQPGLFARDMMAAAREGTLKAMLVVGNGDLLNRYAPHGAEQAVQALETLVVVDMAMTELAQRATVVLPAASFAEVDGTFTSGERRIQRLRKVLDAPGQAKPAWWIIGKLAEKAGVHGFDYHAPVDVLKELTGFVPAYEGVTYTAIERGGLQWPVSGVSHTGTPVLHTEMFPRGKGRFQPFQHKATPAQPADGRLTVMTALVREIAGIRELKHKNLAEVNPEDAAALKLAEGDLVSVQTPAGVVKAQVKVTAEAARGHMMLSLSHGDVEPPAIVSQPAGNSAAALADIVTAYVVVEKEGAPVI